MTDYSELVKALRETAKHLDGISRFPYDDDPAKRIYSKKMIDAADAIEDLQKDLTALQKCYEIADTTVDEVLKQLPKRGEWIGKPLAGYSSVRCSNCKSVFRENSGKWNFCPNCGAKMEAQDG